MSSWSQRLGLALLGLVMGLVLAEGLARAFIPQWRPSWAERAVLWRYDPLLGWSHRAGQKSVFSARHFSVPVAINSAGMRDREHSVARPPEGPKRVLLLGDSFGWGFGVDQDSTLAARLDRPERGLEVVNASVSGYGTAQELLWYRTQGHRYRPDLVLLLVSPNDVDDNRPRSLYWYQKPYFTLERDSLVLRGVPVPRLSWRSRLKIWLVGRTYLGVATRAAWWRIRGLALDALSRPSPTASAAAREKAASSPAVEQDPLANDSSAFRVTRALVRALAAETRAHGSRLTLAVIPTSARLEAWWLDVAGAEGIPALPLRPHVGNSPVVRIPEDSHWNALGNRLAAEALKPFLDSLLVAR